MLLTTDVKFNKIWLKGTKPNESSGWRSEGHNTQLSVDVGKLCISEFILPDTAPTMRHTVCLTFPSVPPSPLPPCPSRPPSCIPLLQYLASLHYDSRMVLGVSFIHSFILVPSFNKHGLSTLTLLMMPTCKGGHACPHGVLSLSRQQANRCRLFTKYLLGLS